MVTTIHVDATTTGGLRAEVAPFLERLEDYTNIHAEPKVLLLRNPNVESGYYDTWQKDHRFGRQTCPTSRHPAWRPSGAIDKVVREALLPSLVCVSAMVIQYSVRKGTVGYHKDPSAYERIVSLTVEGSGVMLVKRGAGQGVPYDLVPGVGVVLEEDDCRGAKHSIVSSQRLGIVLRYADATWTTPY